MKPYHNGKEDSCKIGMIFEPGGRPIGQVFREGDEIVFVRQIGPKHVFRARDALPLGRYGLTQAQRFGVTRLRYIAAEGTYEISFATFLREAEALDFPHERQHVLPRAIWQFEPRYQPHVQMSLLSEGAVP